jgi:hypothetical protein
MDDLLMAKTSRAGKRRQEGTRIRHLDHGLKKIMGLDAALGESVPRSSRARPEKVPRLDRVPHR